MTRTRTIGAIWFAIVAVALTAMTLRLSGVLHGDTLDFVIGLSGLCVSFSTLGALISTRSPGNKIGPLFLALAANEAVVVVLRLWATSSPTSTISGVVGLVEEALRIAGLMAAGIVILIFPTGRLLSRRWLVVVVLLGMTAAFGVLIQALTPGIIDGVPPVLNPFATAATGRFVKALEPAGAIGGIAFVAAAASLIVRFRRSGRAEREQIKLFSIAVFGVVVTIVVLTGLLPKQMNGLLGSLIWQLPYILPPAAIAYAILRKGLFDIDRVISRTVSYAVITAILVGAYIGLVIVFESMTRPITGRSDLAVAASTLIAAALFVPLRGRVQNVVDHRFNRKRYDAERTIEAFSARLRDEVDMQTMRTDLEALVRQTMQPAHVSLWVASPPGGAGSISERT